MKKSLAALSAIGILILSVSAFATPITGTSAGTLAGASGSSTTVTQVQPYQVSWKGPGNQTTFLTAGTSGSNTISQDYATLGGTGVKLASLMWANNDNLDGTVNINWNVSVNLTDPSFTTSLGTNTLNVGLHNGSQNDTLNLDSLSGVSWNFGTWVVSNFRYVDNTVPLNNLEWTTTKGQTDTLWIEADFKNNDPAGAPVPEPGTVMLLGAGFLGLAVYGKRRQRA